MKQITFTFYKDTNLEEPQAEANQYISLFFSELRKQCMETVIVLDETLTEEQYVVTVAVNGDLQPFVMPDLSVERYVLSAIEEYPTA